MILRLLDFLSVLVVALAAAGLYAISYETGEVRRELATIAREMAAEQARIEDLEARWADLDSPANLRAQAEKASLGLQPATARQIIGEDDMDALLYLAAESAGALPDPAAPPAARPGAPAGPAPLPRTIPAAAAPLPKPLLHTGGRR